MAAYSNLPPAAKAGTSGQTPRGGEPGPLDLTGLSLEQLMELPVGGGSSSDPDQARAQRAAVPRAEAQPGEPGRADDLPADLTALSLADLMNLRMRAPKPDEDQSEDKEPAEQEPEAEERPPDAPQPEKSSRPVASDGAPPNASAGDGAAEPEALDLGALVEEATRVLASLAILEGADLVAGAGVESDMDRSDNFGAPGAGSRGEIAPFDSAKTADFFLDRAGGEEAEGGDPAPTASVASSAHGPGDSEFPAAAAAGKGDKGLEPSGPDHGKDGKHDEDGKHDGDDEDGKGDDEGDKDGGDDEDGDGEGDSGKGDDEGKDGGDDEDGDGGGDSGSGDDVLVGGAGDDVLDGGGGKDDVFGGMGDDVLRGGGGSDTLSGDGGDDLLDGGGGKDVLLGGDGDDILIWDPSDDGVHGGAGSDTLRAGHRDVDLDKFDGAVSGIERIDLGIGAEDNELVLSAQDLLDISDTDVLAVLGDSDDRADAGSGWTYVGPDGDGNDVYSQMVGPDLATLFLDADISVNPDILF